MSGDATARLGYRFEAVFARNLIRIAAVAVGLSTLSFAVGVAGDLSMTATPNYGERVVLRIPPELPDDTLRAAPLPPMLSTASAEASTPARVSYAPLRTRTFHADYLVNDAEELVLVSVPKVRQVCASLRPEQLKGA